MARDFRVSGVVSGRPELPGEYVWCGMALVVRREGDSIRSWGADIDGDYEASALAEARRRADAWEASQ